jgi:hypothetical protein
MELLFTLLLASALVGLLIGLKYKVYMLGAWSPVVALVSATATQLNDFDFVEGAATVFACLTISQVTYLFVTWSELDLRWSAGNPSDERSGNDGQSGVSEKEHHHRPPSYLAK